MKYRTQKITVEHNVTVNDNIIHRLTITQLVTNDRRVWLRLRHAIVGVSQAPPDYLGPWSSLTQIPFNKVIY